MEGSQLIKLTPEQIAAILADHKKWLLNQDGGKKADLRFANLRSADLRFANLHFADLSFADLSFADLRSADLSSADLSSANLHFANLKEAKESELVLSRTEIVPREGEIIGWKQCRNNILVKLRIPPDAKRSNGLGRKCRAECVEVIEIIGDVEAVSIRDGKTTYRVGQTVICDSWNADRLVECGGGIHFYLTREEAVAHS